MKNTKVEKMTLVINVFIKNFSQNYVEKKYSMPKNVAEEFGVFEETAIEPKEKDKFFEDFCLKTVNIEPSGGHQDGL